MLHAGLDLSRKKLDVCLISDAGDHVDQLVSPPDRDALRTLARRIEETHCQPVSAVIESMTGARFVHDTLEAEGWDVEIADAAKVKGLAPLACKTDKIDSQVLAMLSHRDLVPAIWLPDPRVREERELARFRLHLVKHKSALKNRIHSALISFGKPCPVTDLFGVEGRKLLERLEIPEPWRSNITASVALIDDLERQISETNARLKQGHADHPYIPLLRSAPGIGWVLAFTIASEIGEIERFASPAKLAGYTGLCPRVNQSGDKDRRGPITKHGPTYLRWALLEATMHALKHPAYSERYQRTKRRLGKQRGAKVAQIDIARRLAHAIWHMLSRQEEFAPRGAAFRLAA
ncbi:MAG: IS110 family transposase [Solirubrobacterales bacterium]